MITHTSIQIERRRLELDADKVEAIVAEWVKQQLPTSLKDICGEPKIDVDFEGIAVRVEVEYSIESGWTSDRIEDLKLGAEPT